MFAGITSEEMHLHGQRTVCDGVAQSFREGLTSTFCFGSRPTMLSFAAVPTVCHSGQPHRPARGLPFFRRA